MPVFSYVSDRFIGISHSGPVTADAEGSVELTDTEVTQLVDLIKENGGEYDVKKLDLQNKYPELYDKLDDACRSMAYKAEYDFWVIEGYENGYYDVDTNEVIALCEEKYGFKFEFDEKKFREENGYEPDDDIEDSVDEARCDAFDNWVEEYRCSLDHDEEIEFLSEVFGLEPNVDDVDYEVEIPDAIVDMAVKGN